MLWKQSSKGQSAWVCVRPITLSSAVSRDCHLSWLDTKIKCSRLTTILEWLCLASLQMLEFFVNTCEMSAWTTRSHSGPRSPSTVSSSKSLKVQITYKLESQVKTQKGSKRPYGVGLLIAGIDSNGPHLFETCPSGNYYEYEVIPV